MLVTICKAHFSFIMRYFFIYYAPFLFSQFIILILNFAFTGRGSIFPSLHALLRSFNTLLCFEILPSRGGVTLSHFSTPSFAPSTLSSTSKSRFHRARSRFSYSPRPPSLLRLSPLLRNLSFTGRGALSLASTPQKAPPPLSKASKSHLSGAR